MKTFHVELEVASTHIFHIDANTPEEAMDIAEQGLQSGEDVGEIIDSEIISSDAFTEALQ